MKLEARAVTAGIDYGMAEITIEGDKIVDVKPIDGKNETGLIALPGFVDIHTHGRSGFDFADATDEAFATMGHDRLSDGVTSFLATGLTLPEENLAELCRAAERYKAKGEGANCLGVHLEGPFFNPECAGAQNPKYLKKPDLGMVERLNAISKVLKVSFSPELAGSEAFVKGLVERGIVASLGHSAADYECFERMRQAGLTHITHFCNVVTPLHHLRPGVVGGSLLADDVFVELICDGVHIKDPMLKIISRMKGADRMMIITDSMRAAGCPDGEYTLGGLPVIVADGCARVKNDDGSAGAVAGSTCRYYQGFQRLASVSELPIKEIIKAAGYNQLRSLGITDRGELKAGQKADIVLVNEKFEPLRTIVNGREVWKA